MEDYAMQEQGEITLHRGVIVNILEDNGEYMKGEINGKVGTFPSKVSKNSGIPLMVCCRMLIDSHLHLQYVEFTEIPGQPEFGRPSSMSQSVEEPDAESRRKNLLSFTL
jgi:Variant SH3 domain